MRSGWTRQPGGPQATDWFGGNYSTRRRRAAADDLSTCSALGERRRHQLHLLSLCEPSSSSRFVWGSLVWHRPPPSAARRKFSCFYAEKRLSRDDGADDLRLCVWTSDRCAAPHTHSNCQPTRWQKVLQKKLDVRLVGKQSHQTTDMSEGHYLTHIRSNEISENKIILELLRLDKGAS